MESKKEQRTVAKNATVQLGRLATALFSYKLQPFGAPMDKRIGYNVHLLADEQIKRCIFLTKELDMTDKEVVIYARTLHGLFSEYLIKCIGRTDL